ncbi:hypothetical protein [Sphingobium nicotianae]|nr:hypothetical protein [Sphingobium nicotianae]
MRGWSFPVLKPKYGREGVRPLVYSLPLGKDASVINRQRADGP